MSLKLFAGNRGHGKTCTCSKEVYDGFLGKRKIFSNYALSFPHEPIDLQWMMDNDKEINHCILAIDELTLWADCRCSSSERNRLFTYIIQQSRHRFVDILATVQFISTVDNRIRESMDYRYQCEAWKLDPDIPGGLRRATIEEIDSRNVDRILVVKTDYTQEVETAFMYDPAPVFPLYDSDEWISMPNFETRAERRTREAAEEKALLLRGKVQKTH